MLPASGFVSAAESLSRNLAILIMPAFVLGNGIAAVMMRHTHSAMLEVLRRIGLNTASLVTRWPFSKDTGQGRDKTAAINHNIPLIQPRSVTLLKLQSPITI